ncbi:MAG UNVERIFIED_CONTAM: tRNA-dihydrouridine synthase [Planctomycetaceae bacterium]|jgi:nifR3 family TIM-barrel protein
MRASEAASLSDTVDPIQQFCRTPLRIGSREFSARFFLAPLAGYTHLAFRTVLRRLGGLGLATTDLVQATMLCSQRPRSLELVATSAEDRPLSVQIFSGSTPDLVRAAIWLQEHGYEGIDINMGCPMAKVNGSGGGARLMCNVDGAVRMVEAVIAAVNLPVTVKMRLGWDASNLTAPALAAAFEAVGVAAVTIHGRTRAQGFQGTVNRDGIRAVVAAVRSMPVIANGDVRTPEDAFSMIRETGCAAVAIGRGAMLDPWIFRRLQQRVWGEREQEPAADEQVEFLRQHFELMGEQHHERACVLFRKFAAWYGARLGIPEDLEDRLRRFESADEFAELVGAIRERHGERMRPIPTALLKVPNGPVEHW